jgi:rare lipoprotein A
MKRIIWLLIGLLISGCAPAPRYHYTQPKPKYPARKPTGKSKSAPPPMLVKGVQHTAILTASFYGEKDGFHGRKTANGEVFDKSALTAAHKTLPFGTILKVTFPKTGRSVNVRINDRGPFVPGRDIDLSYGAALKLGLVNHGVGKVKVTVIKWGTGETRDQD